MRRSFIALLVALVAMPLTGCATSQTAPTAACDAAAVAALDAEQKLYDTHPLWDVEVPGADATDEAWAAYEALEADEEAQWNAIYAPIYANCETPADWWAAAKKHPGIAGVTDADFLDPSSLQSLCTGNEAAPACQGIDAWLATPPS